MAPPNYGPVPDKSNHWTGAQTPRGPRERDPRLLDLRQDITNAFQVERRDSLKKYEGTVHAIVNGLDEHRMQFKYVGQNVNGTSDGLEEGRLSKGQDAARPIYFSDFAHTLGFSTRFISRAFDNTDCRLEIVDSADAAAAGAVTVGGTASATCSGVKVATGSHEYIPTSATLIPQLLTPGVTMVNNGKNFVLAGLSDQYGDMNHDDILVAQLDYILDLAKINLVEVAKGILATLSVTNYSDGAASGYWGLTTDLDNVAADTENWCHGDNGGTEVGATTMAMLLLHFYESSLRAYQHWSADTDITTLNTTIDAIIKALIDPDDAPALALRWDNTNGVARATRDFDLLPEPVHDGTYWTDPDYPMRIFARNYLNAIVGGIAIARGTYATQGQRMLDHIATYTSTTLPGQALGGWAQMLYCWGAASQTGAPPWWEACWPIYGYAVGRDARKLRTMWLAMEATRSAAAAKNRPFGTTTTGSTAYKMGWEYVLWLETYAPDPFDPPNNGGVIGTPMSDPQKWPFVTMLARNMALAMFAAWRFLPNPNYGMFVRGMADKLLYLFSDNQGGGLPRIKALGTLYQNDGGPATDVIVPQAAPYAWFAHVMQCALEMTASPS